jgi:hypothetical protein
MLTTRYIIRLSPQYYICCDVGMVDFLQNVADGLMVRITYYVTGVY